MLKLGVKPGVRVVLVGDFAFDADLAGELDDAGAARRGQGPVDALFYATTQPGDLARLPALAKRLSPAGALWVVRPKGPGTPVTEVDTRKRGLAAGLVDVKVVSFSPTHSALKFVIPVAKRR
jgi:hypothetical protein